MAQLVSFFSSSWSKASFASVPSFLVPHMCLWGWPNLYKTQKQVFENLFSFWYLPLGGERMKSWVFETCFSWQSLFWYNLKALLTVRSGRTLTQPRDSMLNWKSWGISWTNYQYCPMYWVMWCKKAAERGDHSFDCGGCAASMLRWGTSAAGTSPVCDWTYLDLLWRL